jgi:hypothetical protein
VQTTAIRRVMGSSLEMRLTDRTSLQFEKILRNARGQSPSAAERRQKLGHFARGVRVALGAGGFDPVA